MTYVKLIIAGCILVWLVFFSGLNACSLSENRLSGIRQAARDGDNDARYAIVMQTEPYKAPAFNDFGPVFPDIVSNDTVQLYRQQLAEAGYEPMLTVMLREEEAEYRSAHPIIKDYHELNDIRIKWFKYGIEHNCYPFYDKIIDQYKTMYREFGNNPEDKAAMLYYRQQGFEKGVPDCLIDSLINQGVIAVFKAGMRAYDFEHERQAGTGGAHKLLWSWYISTKYIITGWFSLIFTSKYWWSALLAFLCYFLVVGGAAVLLYKLVLSNHDYCLELTIPVVRFGAFNMLMAIIGSCLIEYWQPLWGLPIVRATAEMEMPAGYYGWIAVLVVLLSVWWGVIEPGFIIIKEIFLSIRDGEGLVHILLIPVLSLITYIGVLFITLSLSYLFSVVFLIFVTQYAMRKVGGIAIESITTKKTTNYPSYWSDQRYINGRAVRGHINPDGSLTEQGTGKVYPASSFSMI